MGQVRIVWTQRASKVLMACPPIGYNYFHQILCLCVWSLFISLLVCLSVFLLFCLLVVCCSACLIVLCSVCLSIYRSPKQHPFSKKLSQYDLTAFACLDHINWSFICYWTRPGRQYPLLIIFPHLIFGVFRYACTLKSLNYASVFPSSLSPYLFLKTWMTGAHYQQSILHAMKCCLFWLFDKSQDRPFLPHIKSTAGLLCFSCCGLVLFDLR